MKINYFSPAHLIYIFAALALCFALFLILRKKSLRTRRYAVLAIMLLNVAQHLLKTVIYPDPAYDGLGFTALSTAYNMCAFLILASPLALFVRSGAFRDFIFYIGTSAGILALLIPYWNIGDSAFDVEVIRFFICHALLFSSSLLPLLLGLHKPSYKSFYKLGLCFLSALLVILINDAVCVALGIYPGVEHLPFAEALYVINPVWMYGIAESFPAYEAIMSVIKALSPPPWTGDNPAGMNIPILWYAIPVYLLVTLIAFPICAFVDRHNFKRAVSKLFTKKQ